jgi:hypothetical protein
MTDKEINLAGRANKYEACSGQPKDKALQTKDCSWATGEALYLYQWHYTKNYCNVFLNLAARYAIRWNTEDELKAQNICD